VTSRVLLPDLTVATRTLVTGGEHKKPVITYTTLDGQPLIPATRPPMDVPEDLGDPEEMKRRITVGWASPVAIRAATEQGAMPVHMDTGSSYRALKNLLYVRDFDYIVKEELRYGDHSFRERWFYVRSERIVYIHKVAWPHEFVGTFGLNGFLPPEGVAQPFDGQRDVVMDHTIHVGDRTIYRINPPRRQIHPVFTVAPYERIRQGSMGNENHYTVLTDKRLLVFDTKKEPDFLETPREKIPSGDAKPELTFPITHSLDTYSLRATFWPRMSQWSFWYSIPRNGEGVGFCEIYDDDGKLLRKTNMDWLMRTVPPNEERISPGIAHVLHRWERDSGVITGLFSPAVGTVLHANHYRSGEAVSELKERSVNVWLMVLVSAVVTVSAFLLMRLYRVSGWRCILWSMAVFAMGLPALLTFLAMHPFPRRAKCPACGRPRLLNEDRCARCRAEWPMPARRATDVFATV
jgi:hypothetical protein